MMKRKLILTGAALSLAVAMTGCGGKPVINQQPSSQAQLISMEAAQEVALKAANIAAEDAAISATTLNEVAGTSCYKVEFTSGDYAYAYTVNAETGAVMEMSSREKNAVDTQAQTEATVPAADSATTQSSAAATATPATPGVVKPSVIPVPPTTPAADENSKEDAAKPSGEAQDTQESSGEAPQEERIDSMTAQTSDSQESGTEQITETSGKGTNAGRVAAAAAAGAVVVGGGGAAVYVTMIKGKFKFK